MFGLSDGEEIMIIIILVRFDTMPECDGQTGQADGRTDIFALAIPAFAYATALLKIAKLLQWSNSQIYNSTEELNENQLHLDSRWYLNLKVKHSSSNTKTQCVR